MNFYGSTVYLVEKLEAFVSYRIPEIWAVQSEEFASCYQFTRALSHILSECAVPSFSVHLAQGTANYAFSMFLQRLMDEIRYSCIRGARNPAFAVFVGGRPVKSVQDILHLLNEIAESFLVLAFCECLEETTAEFPNRPNLDFMLTQSNTLSLKANILELLEAFNEIGVDLDLGAHIGTSSFDCIPLSKSKLHKAILERLPILCCGHEEISLEVRKARVSAFISFMKARCVDPCQKTFPELVKFLSQQVLERFDILARGAVALPQCTATAESTTNPANLSVPSSEGHQPLAPTRGWSEREKRLLTEAISKFGRQWAQVYEFLRSHRVAKSNAAVRNRGRRVAREVSRMQLAQQRMEREQAVPCWTFTYISKKNTFASIPPPVVHSHKWEFEPEVAEESLVLDYVSMPIEPSFLEPLLGMTCTVPVRFPYNREPQSSDHIFVLVATSGGARIEVDVTFRPYFKKQLETKFWELEKIRLYANEQTPGSSFQSRVCVKQAHSVSTASLRRVLDALEVRWVRYISFGTKMDVATALRIYTPALTSMNNYRSGTTLVNLPGNFFDLSANQHFAGMSPTDLPVFLGFAGAMTNHHGTVTLHEQFNQLLDQDSDTRERRTQFLFGGMQARFNTRSPLGTHTRTIYNTISHTLKRASQLTYKVPKKVLAAKRVITSLKNVLNHMEREMGVRPHGYRIEIRLPAKDLRDAINICLKNNLFYVRTFHHDCGWDDKFDEFCWTAPSANLLLDPSSPIPVVAVSLPTIVGQARRLIRRVERMRLLRRRESRTIDQGTSQDFVDLYNAMGFHSTNWKFGRKELIPTRMSKLVELLVEKGQYAYGEAYMPSSELSRRYRVARVLRFLEQE